LDFALEDAVGLSDRFFRALAAAATAAALIGSLSAASQADPTTFRIGQSSPANTFLAIWMADDAGLYEANRLNLEIVPMAGGRDMASVLSASCARGCA
jgi:ABC-type nitrate/sulfonate/bicarbonate transport system substrate-binding protein